MERYSFFGWFGWALGTFAALNWGLKGFADFNLVHFLFGRNRTWERAVYMFIGLAGAFSLVRFFQFIFAPSIEREEMVREMNRML